MRKAAGIFLIVIGVFGLLVAGAIHVSGLILGVIKWAVPFMLISFGAALTKQTKN